MNDALSGSLVGTDGVLSMTSGPYSFMSQMYYERRLDRPMFSVCIPSDEGKDTTPSARSVVLGGVVREDETAPLPMGHNVAAEQNKTFYSLNIKSVAFDNRFDNVKVLPEVDLFALNGPEGVLIDPSLDTSYFHESIGSTWFAFWKGFTLKDFGEAILAGITKKELDNMPTLIIEFEDKPVEKPVEEDLSDFENLNPEVTFEGGMLDLRISLPTVSDGENDTNIVMDAASFEHKDGAVLLRVQPQHYFTYNPTTDRYHPNIDTKSTRSVIGSNLLRGYTTIFDLEEGRVGFEASSTDCDGEVRIIPPGPDFVAQINKISLGDLNAQQEEEEDPPRQPDPLAQNTDNALAVDETDQEVAPPATFALDAQDVTDDEPQVRRGFDVGSIWDWLGPLALIFGFVGTLIVHGLGVGGEEDDLEEPEFVEKDFPKTASYDPPPPPPPPAPLGSYHVV